MFSYVTAPNFQNVYVAAKKISKSLSPIYVTPVWLGSFIADFLRNFMKLSKSETSWNFNETSMKLFLVFLKLWNFQTTKKIKLMKERKGIFIGKYTIIWLKSDISLQKLCVEIFSELAQKKQKAPP